MAEESPELTDVGLEGEGFEEEVDLFERLVYWSPAALFAVSLLFAAITITANPASEYRHRLPAREYYYPREDASVAQMIREAMRPSMPLSAREREERLLVAKVNLDRLIRHYRGSLDQLDFPVTNPYLLQAEANRLLADLAVVDERREYLLRSARAAYRLAEQMEGRDRAGEAAQRWNRQYGAAGRPVPGYSEIDVRRERRMRYIRFRRGVINLELGQRSTARRVLTELEERFSRAEMQRRRTEREGRATRLRSPFGPALFELRAEDRNALHFYLARLHDRGGDREAAEREYRIFLLNAPRSRERFEAKMRLAQIAMERGRDLLAQAERSFGASGARQVDAGRESLATAASLYADVTQASPPPDLLWRAYLEGGRAYLELADTLVADQETTWDALAKVGRGAAERLSALTGNRRPDPRVLQAMGEALVRDAAGASGISGAPARALTGGLLVLATRERTTARDRRNALLRRAREFFDVAGRARGERGLAESRVLIARSLLREGRTEEARRLFAHARETYPFEHVRRAAQHGLALASLEEGDLERAWEAFSRLPPAEAIGPEALLTTRRLRQDVRRLGMGLLEASEALVIPADWIRGAPPGSMQWLEAQRRARNKRRLLTKATEVFRALLAQYGTDDPVIRMTLARAHALRAALLQEPPFGSPEDVAAARGLRMRAADIYHNVAVEHPTHPDDEEALLEGARLFYEAGAYERTIETLEMYIDRHGRSERINRVRNRMGDAYRRLGIFRKAELVLRENAVSSNNPEGRKALFHLGRTYMDWSLIEEDRRHLGGPESPLLATSQEQRPPEDYLLRADHILKWTDFVRALKRQGAATADSPGKHIWSLLDGTVTGLLRGYMPEDELTGKQKSAILEGLNGVLRRPNFYSDRAWRGIELSEVAVDLLRRGNTNLTPTERVALNRQLLYAAYPEAIDPGRIPAGMERLPHTAVEVFRYVRRVPGMGPGSRPWRWSTFGLGEALFRVARRLESEAEAQTDPEEATRLFEARLTHYREAEAILAEALKRYRLHHPAHAPDGLRPEEEPVDYHDVKRSRFKAIYQLGLVYQALDEPKRAQTLFAELLDEETFDATSLQVPAEEGSGGGDLRPLRHNAYVLLGTSLYRSDKYEEAYEVFEQAQEALPLAEGPYLLYMMGESLRAQGRLHEARNKYIQARHAVQGVEEQAPEGPFAEEFGTGYWKDVNEQRIRDLDYLTDAGASGGG